MFLRGRMNTPSNPDFESLQQLLANAFAVQESQIHPQSLADIMRVQRSVVSGKLNLEGAMRHIVESARKVANASGVAIALVNGDRLTYRAGSGTSAVCIGWSVAASLTVAAGTGANREILRVENSLTDMRIQADICRQFGASSLLILPIYLNGGVAGVLDIRFSEPHAFLDGEVRTYRLMAEQIETALYYAARTEPEERRAVELAPIPELLEQTLADFGPAPDDSFVQSADENVIPPIDEGVISPPDFQMLPQNQHPLYARCGAVMADILELPVFKQSLWFASMLSQQVKRIRWTPRQRSSPPVQLSEPSVLKRAALRTSPLTQRAKTSMWPSQWRIPHLAGTTGLSSALLRQREKIFTRLDRWRNDSLVAVGKLSSKFTRSARATMLRPRLKTLTGPNRWRRSSVAITGEVTSVLKRSALMAATLARRATNLAVLNPRVRLVLETVAILLAFAALIVYRGRGPASSLESSTRSNSSAIEQQTRLPKPLPGKSTFAGKPSPEPSPNDSRHPSTALRRVQVGKNEVDYVADDVTMRVFTNKPAAKRSRTPDGRIAQFGDDVTVRYFAPTPGPTRTATR